MALATIAAWSSTVWEPYMKLTPPSLASATAILSSDTACMMAEVMGMFM